MREYILVCMMVTVLTGMMSCSGELTDRSRNVKNKCHTESEYFTLKLRITEQDVKYEKLLNQILAQNLKISEQDRNIVELQKQALEQDRKIVELQKQVLERLIDQMTAEHNFNESLNQEVEQRKEMNKIQEQFILDMSVNISQCMLKSEEANERNKIANRIEERRISTVLNRTSKVQEFTEEQTEILLRLNKTESELMLIKTEQDKKYSEMDTCISEQRRFSSDILTLYKRTDKLRIHLDSLHEKMENVTFRLNTFSEDCQKILQCGRSNGDGVYDIQPRGLGYSIQVYCDMTTDGGGWTVFQRRFNGSVDFFRTWSEYKTGFGNIDGEFWLGNENIHRMSVQGQYKLRIKLEDFSGNRRFAEYSSFGLANEDDKYRLSIGSYSGTAGYNGLGYHNKMKFSTKDADNDMYGGDCASDYSSAWWYRQCHRANLNGLYHNGKMISPAYNTWFSFMNTAGHTNMKATTMMIRKV